MTEVNAKFTIQHIKYIINYNHCVSLFKALPRTYTDVAMDTDGTFLKAIVLVCSLDIIVVIDVTVVD